MYNYKILFSNLRKFKMTFMQNIIDQVKKLIPTTVTP